MRDRSRLERLRTLVVRTARDTVADRVPGLAAEVAFFALLSLPFALLALLGGIGYLARALGPEITGEVRAQLLDLAATFLTASTVDEVVRPVLDELLARGRADLVSAGILLTLWTASRATKVLMEAAVIAYDLEERRRPGWKRRLLAFGLTLGALAVGVAVLPLLVAGPRLGATLAEPLGLTDVFATAWRILYWPLAAALGVAALATFYHVALPWWTPWRRDLPGAVVAAALWLLGGVSLRIYADRAVLGADSVFGPLAAPIVLLLWLYVTALAVLVGAEVNAEIERMWPTAGVPRPRDR